jgi:hypothetical protein
VGGQVRQVGHRLGPRRVAARVVRHDAGQGLGEDGLASLELFLKFNKHNTKM